jgi:hypothetical protein
MINAPKENSLEHAVLLKLIESEEGICYLDFPENSELRNEEKLEEIVRNLRHGMYESDGDKNLAFDS